MFVNPRERRMMKLSLRLGVMLLTFTCVLAFLLTRGGLASTPASGSLSLSNPSLGYAAGPFLV
ncbi:MAG TPA: hypothetical protein VGC89_20680, partial [Pyrinomonadaceae bacterium]